MDYAYHAGQEYIKKCALKEDMEMDAFRLELSRFWDNVMLSIMQATTDTNIRNTYRMLIQMARNQVAALNWLDTPEVFTSTAAVNKGKRRTPWVGLAGVLLLLGLTAWFAVPHKERSMVYAVLIGVGVALILIQFIVFLVSLSTKPTVKVRAEQRISPEIVRSSLQRLTREIDAQVDSLQAMLVEAEIPDNGDVDISLAKELLRIPRDKRSMEVNDAVDRFLTRQKVEQVLYTPDRQELFMILPGEQDMTIEPAFIKGDAVLSIGVACTRVGG